MQYTFYINDKKTGSYSTLAQAIEAASEEELLEIGWCMSLNTVWAESPSNNEISYKIIKGK